MKCLWPAIHSPSGLQAGLLTRRKLSFETCFGSLPSRFMIQMLSPPARSLVKAIHCPSGEKRGCMSQETPALIALASPPAAGIV